MKYGLIGEKLSHSFSKIIHDRLGDYGYELCEVAPEELDSFMTKRDFLGINVTIPYKQAVIPYLDFIDNSAKRIGAVNTVVNRDGKLFGYNTDYYGMIALLNHAGIEPVGKKAAILGTGGTAKTAYAVLRSTGADIIIFAGRKKRVGNTDYEELISRHSDAEIIINTTPLGMYPYLFSSAVKLDSFSRLSGVLDAVYNPLNTTFIQEARKKGARAEGGLYMLVAQAVYASEFFFDKKYPEDIIERIYNEIKEEKENIVLIGMPASGKSTVGKILAKRLGRRLIDTDELIEERAGMPIKEIFDAKGEDEFRRIESEVIKELSKETSLIISTGGGAILREENISALKFNGKLYFIDRPLQDLVPTESRPLSSTKEQIEKRFSERYELYLAACDKRIDADCTPEAVADKILEK